MAFLARIRFWIALGLPLLAALLVLLLGFRRARVANQKGLEEVQAIAEAVNRLAADATADPPKVYGEGWGSRLEALKEQYEQQRKKVEQLIKQPPAYVGIGDVRQWEELFIGLDDAEGTDQPLGRIVAMLSPEARDMIKRTAAKLRNQGVLREVVPDAEKERLLDELNDRVLKREGLHLVVPELMTDELRDLFSGLLGGEGSAARDKAVLRRERPMLNRRLLEHALGGWIAPSTERTFFAGYFERRAFQTPLNPGIWRRAYESRMDGLYDELRTRFFILGADALDKVDYSDPEVLAPDEQEMRDQEKAYWIQRYAVKAIAALNPEYSLDRLYPLEAKALDALGEDGEKPEPVDPETFTVPVFHTFRFIGAPERLMHYSHGRYYRTIGFQISVALKFQDVPELLRALLENEASFQLTSLDVAHYPRSGRASDGLAGRRAARSSRRRSRSISGARERLYGEDYGGDYERPGRYERLRPGERGPLDELVETARERLSWELVDVIVEGYVLDALPEQTPEEENARKVGASPADLELPF